MENIFLNKLHPRFRETDGKMFFTTSDLLSLNEWPEDPLIELLNGEIYMAPSPSTQHQEILTELLYQIKTYVNQHQIARVFPAPYDVILSDLDYVVPDLSVVLNLNEKIITKKNIQGTPNLIIEIVSSNRNNDFIRKRDLYEKFGVDEYLIVDPDNSVVFQYLLNENGTFNTPIEYSFYQEIPCKTLNNYHLSLEKIKL
jgi:Uma2 family endonuclease